MLQNMKLHNSSPPSLLIRYILNLQIKSQFVKIEFIHIFSLVFNSKNLRNSLKFQLNSLLED
jgi:hypothetical protein